MARNEKAHMNSDIELEELDVDNDEKRLDVANHKGGFQKRDRFQEKDVVRTGYTVLSAISVSLLLVLAIPVLLTFLIKSPAPQEHLLILGINYSKVLCFFFLTTAILAYSSLFFFRLRPVAVFVLFLFFLFCCFPFVVGLRSDLTLQEAITGIGFLSNWPFFLKPAYLLVEFLIPAGMITYLFLQIRGILTKEPHQYSYLWAAVYLLIGAFLGLSILEEVGQPSILTVLKQKGIIANTQNREPAAATFERRFFSKGEDPSELGYEVAPHRIFENPQVPARSALEAASNAETSIQLDQKVQLLSDRVDRVMEILNQMPAFLAMQKEIYLMAYKMLKEEGGSRLPAAVSKEESAEDGIAIERLNEQVKELCIKVDRIMETLRVVEQPSQEGQEGAAEKGIVQ